MEDNKNNEVHYIPKDALIPIDIGAGYLERLHKMLVFLLHDKTKEQVEEFNTLLKSNSIPEDTWMYHYHTIQTFIVMVEDIAIKKGITTIKNLNDIK